MNVTLIGATGMVGSRILNELLMRSHRVKALVRSPEKLQPHPALQAVRGDVFDISSLVPAFAGSDAVVYAYCPTREHPDRKGEHFRAITLTVRALAQAKVTRILAVAGCGTLNYRQGVKVMDAPIFPKQWEMGAISTAEIPRVLREHPELDWTALSPALWITPGERTGKFQLGRDNLLFDDKGESRISAEDFAVAMVDELEAPKNIRRRFTLAY